MSITDFAASPGTGSDTIEGVRYANHYYDADMAAFSIPASEHSTITMWGREREFDAYRNMVERFAKPGAVFACVSDSYDLWNVLEHAWGGDFARRPRAERR